MKQQVMGDQSSAGPPRVLVVMGNIPYWGNERANIQLFRLLREEDFVTHFIVNKRYHRIRDEVEQLGSTWSAAQFGVRLRRTWNPIYAVRMSLDVARSSYAILKAALEFKPTHIHVVDFHMFLHALPAIAILRKPVIFRLPVPPWDGLFYKILWSRLISPWVSVFVCNSQFSVQKVLSAGIEPRKVHLIYNCRPERPLMKSSISYAQINGPLVTFIGQISPHKGIDLFIDAAIQICSERSEVSFCVAGVGFDWLRAELEKRVRKTSTEDRVRFLGYVEFIPELLSKTVIHTWPGLHGDSLPNVVLEAKSAGVPTVAFNTSGLPELVTDGVDGIICKKKTSEALAEAILYYLDHEEERKRAGQAAKASLVRFSEEAFIREWKKVFLETMR